MRRKILVDLLNLATEEIAGVGTFAKNLFQLWLPQSQHLSITFIASAAIDASQVFGLDERMVRVRYVGARHVLARFMYQQLVLPLIMRNFDLYYNPALGIPLLSRWLAPRSKLVVTIHDMIPFYFPKKYGFVRSALVRMMSITAARVAHRVITVSENSKQDILKLSGISRDKVEVVYNFVLRSFERDNQEDGSYFLCISTLEPGKNVEQVIRGFGKFIRKSGDKYKFYWVGRIGWVYSAEYLDDLIRQEGLEQLFILTGYIDDERKTVMIRNCTGIVYLSHYEGFGLPVLEGMMFNKPALVSDNSSLPEVVGKAGTTCDRLDEEAIAIGMRYLIDNRLQLCASIPEQLVKFAPEKQIATFVGVLDELLR
jgi:glycosyltransferase involved in cell wall biosynthesis